jgi:hypothetical protein
MGLYAIPCRQCGQIFMWFSGNTSQWCGKCLTGLQPKPREELEGQSEAEIKTTSVDALSDPAKPAP